MEKQNNTGLGLIVAIIERVRNEKSLFGSALKKLVNSTEEELSQFLNTKHVLRPEKEKDILFPLFTRSNLYIKALSGRKMIIHNDWEANGGIIFNFRDQILENNGVATSKTSLEFNGIIGNFVFADVFSSLSGTWNQKWFSQHQIIEFCKKFPNLLEDGYAVFLAKKDEKLPINENKPEDNLRVFMVKIYPAYLRAEMFHLEFNGVWQNTSRYCVISPRLFSVAQTV